MNLFIKPLHKTNSIPKALIFIMQGNPCTIKFIVVTKDTLRRAQIGT